jgi:hypothetical protein
VPHPLDCDREAVAPVVCWRFSAASFSSAGSGRKRGPTLLEIHNENSATTIAARKIETLDNIELVIVRDEILPERIFAEKEEEQAKVDSLYKHQAGRVPSASRSSARTASLYVSFFRSLHRLKPTTHQPE